MVSFSANVSDSCSQRSQKAQLYTTRLLKIACQLKLERLQSSVRHAVDLQLLDMLYLPAGLRMSCPSFIIGARTLSTLSDNCVRINNWNEEDSLWILEYALRNVSAFIPVCVWIATPTMNVFVSTCCRVGWALSNPRINVMQRDGMHKSQIVPKCLQFYSKLPKVCVSHPPSLAEGHTDSRGCRPSRLLLQDCSLCWAHAFVSELLWEDSHLLDWLNV